MVIAIEESLEQVKIALSNKDPLLIKAQIHRMKSPLNTMEIYDLVHKISNLETQLIQNTPIEKIEPELNSAIDGANTLVKMLRQEFSINE